MSSAALSGSAPRKVFHDTELLEDILLYLGNRDLIVNAYQVSRRWKAVIEGSSKIQRKLFFRPNPTSSTVKHRDKNLLIASVADNLFNTRFRNGVLLNLDTAFSILSMSNPALCMTPPLKQRWLTPNASWKRMQIGCPSITKLRWQVRRLDIPGIPLGLPTAIAQFEFPNGLTMGDYYNLLLGTKGSHCIIWPERWKQAYLLGFRPPANLVDAFRTHDRWVANSDDALLVIQSIYPQVPTTGTRLPPKPLPRESVWDPMDLSDYRANLKKLEILELTTNPDIETLSWEYVELFTDATSAMWSFLDSAEGLAEIQDLTGS